MEQSFNINDLDRLPRGFDFVQAVDAGNLAFRQSLPMTGPVVSNQEPHIIRVAEVRFDSKDAAQLEKWKGMVEETGLAPLLDIN
jgi:hypothetical protein